ncbi:MAG: DUF1145 domain-containing protein [Proteobacteria bacterium]|jgi:uncharacterized protein YhhL (DUF1145 family)|uniref:DUF1145 domain-containing protein n=1 Tax=SAR92 bacterium BACL26 MAG-121220-bin70 TaxID=1655626 RepID=A0A0R2TYV3_9GAMM|nr:MAG: hypothetical protein ABS24_08345 [SAR92 bacterium BACL26 MAG-121220-bin70]MDA0796390.1 DUF1145 domain-containing protein [Pseudomonadota bacterium]MDA1352246.1 DUF1145 domain-containing protein [Pseudomonadota bacterium]|tara:strand:- start:803 stop:1060 length:258 start_codon:yes stop_codon:yes gene_type:complete
MQKFAQINMYILAGFWLAFVVNLVMPFGGSLGTGVLWAGMVFLVLHVIELALVYSKLKAVDRNGTSDIVAVLAFGILYWKPLLKK